MQHRKGDAFKRVRKIEEAELISTDAYICGFVGTIQASKFG